MKIIRNQQFIDGIEQNKTHPETFKIPSEEEKKDIAVKDFVKVGFTNELGNSERMWLEIEEAEYPIFRGRLDNNPVVMRGIDYGDKFEINTNHILDIIKM